VGGIDHEITNGKPGFFRHLLFLHLATDAATTKKRGDPRNIATKTAKPPKKYPKRTRLAPRPGRCLAPNGRKSPGGMDFDCNANPTWPIAI
ncbi:MAG: hypothetical protein V3R55_06155, partial [Alphaproteobacteria bacterium]